jgi:hypothetical protein
VKEVEVPDQADAADPEGAEPPGGRLAADRVHREERHPQAGQHGLLDRLRVLEHEPGAMADTRGPESPLGQLARRGAHLPHQERLVGEPRRGDLPA